MGWYQLAARRIRPSLTLSRMLVPIRMNVAKECDPATATRRTKPERHCDHIPRVVLDQGYGDDRHWGSLSCGVRTHARRFGWPSRSRGGKELRLTSRIVMQPSTRVHVLDRIFGRSCRVVGEVHRGSWIVRPAQQR